MSNKVMKALLDDKAMCEAINSIAKRQLSRRKKAYASISIFDLEDLEQEIWVKLLESDISDIDSVIDKVDDITEKLAEKGRRKMGKTKGYTFEEVPLSQLPESDRIKMNNMFYGAYNDD